MNNARSPLFSLFGVSIAGLTSIRAYGAEEMFIQESLDRINKYSRPAATFYLLNRYCSLLCLLNISSDANLTKQLGDSTHGYVRRPVCRVVSCVSSVWGERFGGEHDWVLVEYGYLVFVDDTLVGEDPE